MTSYRVFTRDGRAPILVREGFSVWAFVFGPLWLLVNAAWIPAVVAIAVEVVLRVALGGSARAVLGFGVAWLLGLFGRDLLCWSLERRGWVLAHVVVARGRVAAELRLLDAVPELAGRLRGMRVVVVDCGSGNLASAMRALERAGHERGIAATVELTSDPDRVARADRLVLPGQGAFADCARGIAAVDGLGAAITAAVEAGAPYLGICVGMQLMAERGLEHAVTPGFGWIAGDIAPMDPPGLRLPQMGWNELVFEPGAHALLEGIAVGAHAYFVHSYALVGARADQVVATTDYGGPVVAMVAEGNRAGTQFHVEKSQRVGLAILGNFLAWAP